MAIENLCIILQPEQLGLSKFAEWTKLPSHVLRMKREL